MKVAEELDAADKPEATGPAEEPEPATVEAEPVEQVSETDVRATVVEFLKTTDQDTQLGLAIFRKHGGNKLSEVPKENHAALVGELKNCIAAIGTGGATLAAQIGRAAGRARVCQHVQLPVVAGPHKTNK